MLQLSVQSHHKVWFECRFNNYELMLSLGGAAWGGTGGGAGGGALLEPSSRIVVSMVPRHGMVLLQLFTPCAALFGTTT